MQVCYIPNTTTYSGHFWQPSWVLISPSVAGSFQICKIFVVFLSFLFFFFFFSFFFFFFFFSVTVRSFRDGSPVYTLTFVDVKRRGLDRRSSDVIKRIASRL